MHIVFYSDLNYEYQIRSLIRSIDKRGFSNVTYIYYTIGFDSDISREDLIKKRVEIDPKKPRFEFYKPDILLDVTRCFKGHSIFIDSDVIVGKRFDLSSLANDFNYPMLSIGNWDSPFFYWTKDIQSDFPVFNIGDKVSIKTHQENGKIESLNYLTESYVIKNKTGKFLGIKQTDLDGMVIIDHDIMMEYFGVSDITMTYVSTCFMSFNEKCEDIFFEWKSILENEYLLSKREIYFPFQDETALNVILWKRGIRNNYGRIFLNTLYSEAAIEVETNDHIINSLIGGNPNQRCNDSSKVIFYHGMKDPIEINKMLLS